MAEYNDKIANKLGVIGNINYVGGLLSYGVVLSSNLPADKMYAFLFGGSLLLVISGILYIMEAKIKADISHGALNAITQIYNRAAEQLSVADAPKTKIIMDGLKQAPNAILKVKNNK